MIVRYNRRSSSTILEISGLSDWYEIMVGILFGIIGKCFILQLSWSWCHSQKNVWHYSSYRYLISTWRLQYWRNWTWRTRMTLKQSLFQYTFTRNVVSYVDLFFKTSYFLILLKRETLILIFRFQRHLQNRIINQFCILMSLSVLNEIGSGNNVHPSC